MANNNDSGNFTAFIHTRGKARSSTFATSSYLECEEMLVVQIPEQKNAAFSDIIEKCLSELSQPVEEIENCFHTKNERC